MNFTIEDFLRQPISSLDTANYENSEYTATSDGSLDSKSQTSILVFSFGNTLVGIKTKEVSAIVATPAIYQIPFIPKRNSLGFISYSGTAVPVVDLNSMLGLQKQLGNSDAIIIYVDSVFTAILPEKILGVERLVESDEVHLVSRKFRFTKALYKQQSISVLAGSEISKSISER